MYPQKVKLNEDHRYFDDRGLEYMGFSKLFDEFLCKPFNKDLAAYGSAKSAGTSASEVIEKWDKQREEGIRIDDCLDSYAHTGMYRAEDEDIIDGVKEVLKTYDEYHKCAGQLSLYSEQYRVAGTCDKISFVSNRADAAFVMSDYKCFEKEIDFMPKGSPRFLNAPFDYLANTKYVKISFQLSFYSFLFESLTGRKPLHQFIHWIDPRTIKRDSEGNLNVKHKLIPVPYMRSEVVLFLETYKERILTLMTPVKVDAF
jgi:hypothetical protein